VVVGVGVGLGVGVGVPLPFWGAGMYFFPGAPPLMLAEPPFLTFRSLSLTRFFAFGSAMGGSPSPGRVGLPPETFRGL
jgi:hypothetical protein